jgi:hypothetical protein
MNYELRIHGRLLGCALARGAVLDMLLLIKCPLSANMWPGSAQLLVAKVLASIAHRGTQLHKPKHCTNLGSAVGCVLPSAQWHQSPTCTWLLCNHANNWTAQGSNQCLVRLECMQPNAPAVQMTPAFVLILHVAAESPLHGAMGKTVHFVWTQFAHPCLPHQ